jgi:hypothetical protein
VLAYLSSRVSGQTPAISTQPAATPSTIFMYTYIKYLLSQSFPRVILFGPPRELLSFHFTNGSTS